jgi:exopolyphosphatase/guanosine-5'-triphosphate,3'-diphosphate pyrophosphatase
MRIGVFDIGTRATRLLIGDTSDLAFRKNFGQLTRMGEEFDEDDNIRVDGFQRTLGVMREFLQEGARYGVQEYVAVGTAALRKAENREQLLGLFSDVLGIKVTILQKEEEAYLSLLSAFCHFQNEIEKDRPILLIDQGGGSTEISCGELKDNRFHFWGLSSLDLGSVLLKNLFLSDDRREVGRSYRDTMAYIQRVVKQHVSFPELTERPPAQAFGMGSAITNITGVRGNRRQHGRVVTTERMQYLINTRIDLYEESQITIDALLESASSHDRMDDLERDLLMLYGLPVYQSLLDMYQLSRITVCGYGLRYGVFLYLALPGIAEREIPLQKTPLSEVVSSFDDDSSL